METLTIEASKREVSGKTLTIKLEKALTENDYYRLALSPYAVKDEAFDRYGHYRSLTKAKKYSVLSKEQVDDESVGFLGLSEDFAVGF